MVTTQSNHDAAELIHFGPTRFYCNSLLLQTKPYECLLLILVWLSLPFSNWLYASPVTSTGSFPGNQRQMWRNQAMFFILKRQRSKLYWTRAYFCRKVSSRRVKLFQSFRFYVIYESCHSLSEGGTHWFITTVAKCLIQVFCV